MASNEVPPDLKERKVHVHPATTQMRAILTSLRDSNTARDNWVFHADRAIRLVMEFTLNFLPVSPCEVVTPTDTKVEGVTYQKRIVGVSIIRAGESMETALRSCCRNVRIGKILIQRDEETALPRLYYKKLPGDIHTRHVLLMDPMLATGGTAITAIGVLRDVGVPEEKIIFVSLFSCPEGLRKLLGKYPAVTIVTATVDEKLNEKKYIIPGCGDFGDRYFGSVKEAS